VTHSCYRPDMTLLLLLTMALAGAAQQQAEKELIVTITGPQLKGGVVSEITWDGNTLLLQGVFSELGGELKAQYFVVPTESTKLEHRDTQSDASLEYWRKKSNRISPTGLGRIEIGSDTKMPQVGIGSLERRIGDAVDMGGTRTSTLVRLGTLVLHERIGGPEPYDGELWSWSPAELNRIAYVDGKGNLWVAGADGRNAKRIMNGSFTLPAWSEDGRSIAVAERKDSGRRWEISVFRLPRSLWAQ
jgi:hypothetical protein